MSAVAPLPARNAVADRETVIWHDLVQLADVARDCTGPLAYSANDQRLFNLPRFRNGERNLVLAQAWAKAAPADRPAIEAAFGRAFLMQLAEAVREQAVDDVELAGEGE